MTTITLTTRIKAPVQICFDLSRSIDFHQHTTAQSGERAIGGRTAGLIEQGESVTWEATHFRVRQKLTTEIVEMKVPYYFFDRMTQGAFKSMEHSHAFAEEGDLTIMSDIFNYEVPFGFAGKLFDSVVLKKYMTALLRQRNQMIKETAESAGWKKFLKHDQ
jgi:ligand-binding SRPBCC domain-containing protein